MEELNLFHHSLIRIRIFFLFLVYHIDSPNSLSNYICRKFPHIIILKINLY